MSPTLVTSLHSVQVGAPLISGAELKRPGTPERTRLSVFPSYTEQSCTEGSPGDHAVTGDIRISRHRQLVCIRASSHTHHLPEPLIAGPIFWARMLREAMAAIDKSSWREMDVDQISTRLPHDSRTSRRAYSQPVGCVDYEALLCRAADAASSMRS
jgi:hypothetical protein